MMKTQKFLIETNKTLEIVERKIREFENGLDRKGRMQLLKRLLPKAKDFKEHQEIKREYDLLEFQEVKNIAEKPIPTEVKERILTNFNIEMGALKVDMDAKYLELEKQLATFEKTVMPLLDELNAMHKSVNSVVRMGGLLDIEYKTSISGSLVRSSFPVPLNPGLNKNYSYPMKKQMVDLLKLRGGC